MRLSIIIPAFNEAERLPATLAQLERFFSAGASVRDELTVAEVIVVDDGSRDETLAVVRQWQGSLPVRGLRFDENRGKGAAVRAGMLAAEGDCCLFYDADAATPPAEIVKLTRALSGQQADVVIGSRVLGVRENRVSMRWHRRLIGRIYHALCSALVPGIADAACGAKLFTRAAASDVFTRQKIERFAFDIEVLSLAQRLGYKVVEIPVDWTAIPGSKVSLVWDSLNMTWCVLKLYVRHLLRNDLGGEISSTPGGSAGAPPPTDSAQHRVSER